MQSTSSEEDLKKAVFSSVSKIIEMEIRNYHAFIARIDNHLELIKLKTEIEQSKYNSEDLLIRGVTLHLHHGRHNKIFLSSTLISIYSYFEATLEGICSILGESCTSKLKLKDIAGNGVERSKKYLSLVQSIDFGSLNVEWEAITKFNLVRNCFVHAAGNPHNSQSSSKIFSAIKNIPGLSVHGNLILVTTEYLVYILEQIQSFLNGILYKASQNTNV